LHPALTRTGESAPDDEESEEEEASATTATISSIDISWTLSEPSEEEEEALPASLLLSLLLSVSLEAVPNFLAVPCWCHRSKVSSKE